MHALLLALLGCHTAHVISVAYTH